MSTPTTKYRVLVVDDNPGDVTLFEEAIESVGAPIVLVSARNGEKAVQLLSTDRAFDLIMSDLNMPGMNGVELVRRLATNPELKRIPIVLMSSSILSQMPPRIGEGITVPYFTKAATWESFAHMVREIYDVLKTGRAKESARLIAERMTPVAGFAKFTNPKAADGV